MKETCKYCGEEFTIDAEDLALYEDGWIEYPDSCSECALLQDCSDCSFEEYSDADSGL